MAAFDPTELNTLIDEATHEMLLGPDWTKNMVIIDLLKGGGEPAVHACNRIVKKLGTKKTQTQILALNLLEAIVKNTDRRVHVVVQGKDVMKAIVTALGKKGKRGGFLNLDPVKVDKHLQETILALVRQWGEAFASQKKELPGFDATYMQLVKDGWEFPQLQAGDKIVVMPSETGPRNPVTTSHAESRRSNDAFPMYGMGGGQTGGGATHISLAGQGAVTDETAAVREQCTLLRELVSAATSPAALKEDEMVGEVLRSLRAMQRELASTAETTTNESILMSALGLHDDIDKTLEVYEKAIAGRSAPRPAVAAASLVDLDARPVQKPREDPNQFLDDLMGGGSVVGGRSGQSQSPPRAVPGYPVGTAPPAAIPAPSKAAVATPAVIPILPPPPGSRNPFVAPPQNRSPSSSVSRSHDIDDLVSNLSMQPAPVAGQAAPAAASDDFDSFFSNRSAVKTNAAAGLAQDIRPSNPVNAAPRPAAHRDVLDDVFS